MQILIVAVGRLKENYLSEGIVEYRKRMQSWANIKIVEVKEEAYSRDVNDKQKTLIAEKESERLIQVAKSGYTIALDKSGKTLSSDQLATFIQKLMNESKMPLNFLIGGSLGISPVVLDKVDMVISFGPMTFPYQLFRLMLLEQIYRAYTIIENIPYHK